MRRIASLIIGLSMAATPLVASANYQSTVDVNNALHIVQRVTDGTMDADLRRVHSHIAQASELTDGSNVINLPGFEAARALEMGTYQAASDIMIGICQSVQAFNRLDTAVCGQKLLGRTRLGW